VIRRIDGRTPGRFFADEIARPLGLDLYIGTPDDVVHRVAPIKDAPPRDLSQLTDEQRTAAAVYEQLFKAAREAVRSGDTTSTASMLWTADFKHPDLTDVEGYLPSLVNRPDIRRAELPAGNASTDARSLARMYAPLSLGGELEGRRWVSAESIELFNTPHSQWAPGLPPFCLGYQRQVPTFKVSETAFGHGGAGGSLGFADPERGLSFGLTKNQMRAEAGGIAADMVNAVYSCL
jgi:CubicO group peptidase (beta-lactamase class C family)